LLEAKEPRPERPDRLQIYSASSRQPEAKLWDIARARLSKDFRPRLVRLDKLAKI
jgi:hypothetical protein